MVDCDIETLNSPFEGTPFAEAWIELHHSRASWKVCQISFRKNEDQWVPFGNFQLINAKTTKSGFRVFRVKAVRLEFRLSNGSNTVIDSNSGRNYLVESPGRYVVESGHGCRRVGDANIADCLRAMRPSDKYIEIVYVGAKSWRNCFITFSAREESRADWFRDSMQMMRNGQWFRRLECGAGIVFAFNDGADRWDSNNGENYHLTLPGKYVAGNGKLTFCGISDFDMHMP